MEAMGTNEWGSDNRHSSAFENIFGKAGGFNLRVARNDMQLTEIYSAADAVRYLISFSVWADL